MALEIADYFETLYADDVHHDFQQKMSKLRATVDNRTINGGDSLELPNMGTVGMNTKTRDGLLSWLSPSQERVVLTLDDFYSPIYWDKKDARKTHISVGKEYAKASVYAAHRQVDDLITSALELGAGTSAAATGGSGVVVEADVRTAVQTLMEADVDEEELIAAVSPQFYMQLLNSAGSNIASYDFNTARPLQGLPRTFEFYGVKFMVHTRLPLAANGTTRSNFIYCKSSTVFGIDEDIQSRVDWLPEYHGWLATTSLTAGAVVRDGDGVYELTIEEV